jgi:transposase-like protein
MAAEALNEDETVETTIELRQIKSLNNLIEQDHRNIKRIVKPMMRFKSFNTARRTLRGIEAMDMIDQGQVNGINQGNSISQLEFIDEIFGASA